MDRNRNHNIKQENEVIEILSSSDSEDGDDLMVGSHQTPQHPRTHQTPQHSQSHQSSATNTSATTSATNASATTTASATNTSATTTALRRMKLNEYYDANSH